MLEENNIEKKGLQKRTNYLQLAFEIRENMFEKDDLCETIVAEKQKTILMDSETIIRKRLSGLVQNDYINS